MNIFSRLGAFFLEILQVVVFAVSIFLFIYLLIMQPHKIKGSSMEPDFHDAEYLLTDKISYRFGEPKRGDVIVFKSPPDFKDEFIKRIIGIPGDKIKIQSGRVYVNGQQIDEPYLTPGQYTTSGIFITEGVELTIPAKNYFVLGDNRDHSYDGRAFGFIDRSKINGKAWLVYWPPQYAGIVKAFNF